MLRFLTALPPGKVRFTIIDPVGLGENFAAFMHLADYDEPLVTSRIWTEPQHIEQRLADLTAHMENVIQKYLRNQFADDRGVQRPGRRGGRAVPRPGRRQLPGQLQRRGRPPAGQHRRQRRPLRRLHADQRRHQAAAAPGLRPRPTWSRPASCSPGRTAASSGRTPISASIPLHAGRAARPRACHARCSHMVGAGGQATPAGSRCRSSSSRRRRTSAGRSDSRNGIDVPLGRAGATKLQHLKLGKGTSQHVLDRRQDRLRQIDAAARPDHQPGPALQPRRGRAVPDRLQEGRRVQDLCRRTNCRTPG